MSREMNRRGSLILNRLARLAGSLLAFPVYIISFVTPRYQDIWIFGAWFGNKFADNSKYLFLYTIREKPQIRAIWLTQDRKVMNRLLAGGFECYSVYSLAGFFYSLIAGKVIVSCGIWGEVNRFAIARAKTVQLWHGCPIKKIGHDSGSMGLLRRVPIVGSLLQALLNVLMPFNSDRYRFDLYAASCEDLSNIFQTAFGAPANQISITGQPRNDRLLANSWAADIDADNPLAGVEPGYSYRRLFFYLPTHRQSGLSPFDLMQDYGMDFASMQSTLEELDAILLVKSHYFVAPQQSILSKTGRLIFCDDTNLPDIYPALARTDILITDYSSIHFDFLLTDKPIIFAPFDLAGFNRYDRALYFDYDEVCPGPKVETWAEIENLFRENGQAEAFSSQRHAVNSRFNPLPNSMSAERVWEKIASI